MEQERLCSLHSYDILDTPPEEAFTEIAHLAAYICHCPIATVSFIDEERQWYKARVGMDLIQTPREIAFCAHTIMQREILVVPDATLDPRFANNPVVTGEPHVRFYAGLPLINADGHALGSLCVVDIRTRELDFDQAWALESLRKHVIAHLELRRTNLQLREALAEIERLTDQPS